MSVVIVAGNNRPRARRAIESVLRQVFDGAVEVLVVDMSDRSEEEPLGVEHARLRVMTPPTKVSYGAARAAAVEAARGAVVAFLEEHCKALPGWVRGLVEAHRGPWAAVGAEVHNANPGVGWSDAIYMMGYFAWMPPAERGEVLLAATHNTSYRKDLLLEFGARLPDLLTAEPILQEELRKRGYRIFLEPDVRFLHENETSLPGSYVLYWWNRSFGRIRAESRRASLLRRVAYLVLVPFVPWRRMLRLGRYFLRSRRGALWSLARQIPRIWLLDLIAASGLAVGMIWGTPDDDMRFSELELRNERKER